MPQYDELRTTAFLLRADAAERLRGAYSALTFPQAWVDPLLQHLNGEAGQKRTVPIGALNRSIRALVPDVAAVARGVSRADHAGPWLYSADPPEPANLEPLIHAWVQTLVENDGPATGQLWSQLDATLLRWQRVRPGELGWPDKEPTALADTAGATAAVAALPPHLFHLVPEILVAELLGRSDRPDGFPRGFRRYPAPDGRGVELLSWPPLYVTDRRGEWPYSYRVSVSVQTIPFQPLPVVHIGSGIRRWCPRPPRSAGRSISLCMLSELPWLPAGQLSHSFRVAQLRWQRTGTAFTLGWHRKLASIFDHLKLERPLPDLAELTADPTCLFDGKPAAALVHATATAGYVHRAPVGTHARERAQLYEWIANTLGDLLTPATALRRTGSVTIKPQTTTATARRAGLARATDAGHLHINMLWDSPEVQTAVIDAINDDLEIEPTGTPDQRLTWTTPELTVATDFIKIGALGAPLDLDQTIRHPALQLRRAVDERRRTVQERLAAVPGCAALVEIRDAAQFTNPRTDPKRALRLGAADAGRLSQFLVSPADGESSDSIEQRATSAWTDLRRQLSPRVTQPAITVRGGVPDPIDYIAIWMIRQNASTYAWDRVQLPVAIWASSDSPRVYCRARGMTEWMDYKDALLTIATKTSSGLGRCDEADTARFIDDVLTSATTPDRPVLLLTHAQNLRSAWPGLQNGQLLPDVIALGAVNQPATAYPQLRHVRVRADSDDETPQGYGRTADRVGLPSGLWAHPGSTRVFQSVGSKPAAAKRHGSPMGSRLETRTTRSGHDVIETAPGWNPQLVELTVAAQQPGDDPVTWAAIAHALRRASDTYDGDLILPLPLHLAMLTKEYALPDSADPVADDPEANTEDAE